MRIVRYQDQAQSQRYAAEQPDGRLISLEGDPYGDLRSTGQVVTPAALLAPVQPTQILCIGLNYRQHAAETGAKVPEHPVLFVKGINTLQHPGQPIILPRHLHSDQVDYECELAVVIGKPCKNVSPAKALEYVLGYTCCNDVSSRDWQLTRGGGQWCRGKFFDTFCPLGPCLVTPDEIPNPNNLAISTTLNGQTVQSSNTADMIFDIRTLISFLSGSTTLLPGTVILTGTPQGVGMAAKPPRWLVPGDSVTIEIERIGRLTSPVIEEPIAKAGEAA